MNNNARRAGGRSTANNTTKSVTDIAMEHEARKQVQKTFVTSCIEKSVAKVKELRVAGMINNNGAEDIQHTLIMALVVLDETPQSTEMIHTMA